MEVQYVRWWVDIVSHVAPFCQVAFPQQRSKTIRLVALVSAAIETLADLHERLGNVPLQRIRCHPAPGTATEADRLDGGSVLPGFQLPI